MLQFSHVVGMSSSSRSSPYEPLVASVCHSVSNAMTPCVKLNANRYALASGILPEEALFFLSQAKSACMLAGKERLEKAAKICAVVGEQGISEHFALIPITSDTKPQETVHIGIDDTLQINPDDPGVVLFSSGTTGQPKGVILPRRCFVHSQLAEPGSATINYRAAHWIGGAITLLDPVLTGKKLYALGEKATAETLLEAFQNHRITHATFAPTLLQQMKELLTGQSGELSNENRRKWSGYFKCLSTLRCTAGMVDQSTLQFWTDLTGLQFENLYGATELGGVVTKATSNIGVSDDWIPLAAPDELMETSRARLENLYLALRSSCQKETMVRSV